MIVKGCSSITDLRQVLVFQNLATIQLESLVVWSFNEGRGVARECDRYLMGSTDLP